MFKTLKNAWRIPELKKKLLFTLLIVVIYRLGANIPVPYVNPEAFEFAKHMYGSTSILSFLNMLSGDAFGKATLLALGVSPYITASIVIQLLGVAFPNSLGKWSKEGEEGRKKINMLTRIITIVLALVTAIGYVLYLKNGTTLQMLVSEDLHFFNYALMVLCYCAGAALVMWLAEKINESGIGNGISIILFANILAGMASMANLLWLNVFPGDGFKVFDWVGLICSIASIIVLLAMIVLIVWMSDGERRIPIQYAKRVVGRKMYGGQNTNLPIKVNMSGVMPIIFASSITMILPTIREFMGTRVNWFTKLVDGWFLPDKWPYFAVFLVLLIAFAYFYVAISFNPVEVANNIQNNGGAIPGIRSGRPTVQFIKKVLNRITLVGALLVALIACFPMLVNNIAAMFDFVNQVQVGYFQALSFGGSSMMIMVGVALETTRELEAQMTLRNYKGFLD